MEMVNNSGYRLLLMCEHHNALQPCNAREKSIFLKQVQVDETTTVRLNWGFLDESGEMLGFFVVNVIF
jgi:hypothetical protein